MDGSRSSSITPQGHFLPPKSTSFGRALRKRHSAIHDRYNEVVRNGMVIPLRILKIFFSNEESFIEKWMLAT